MERSTPGSLARIRSGRPRSGRSRLARVALFVAFNLLAIGLLLEGGLRLGIALGVPQLRRPELYANVYVHDDFFKLHRAWRPGEGQELALDPRVRGQHHPELGWAVPRTPENPLGAVTLEPYRLDSGPPPILFYGDSFVFDGEPFEDKLPQMLDALAPGQRVHNLGMYGYGLDQIYLGFAETRRLVDPAALLVGIFTPDIDRCVLRFRNRPKPWFELDADGKLGLRGVPVPEDLDAYLRDHPIEIRSYFLAAAGRLLDYARSGSALDSSLERPRKEALARKLVERFIEDAKADGTDLHFVLFVPATGSGWRKRLLIDELSDRGASFIDTEPLLRSALGSDEGFGVFYDETGHLTPRAKRIIAREIAGRWSFPPEGPAR